MGFLIKLINFPYGIYNVDLDHIPLARASHVAKANAILEGEGEQNPQEFVVVINE